MTPLRLAFVQSHVFYGSVETYLRLRSLGWTPPVQVGRAFELTAEWLRFARDL
jgi:hypothetical protein